MTDDDPVTLWIQRMQAGDPAAAARIWAYYSTRLLEMARAQLPRHYARAADENDAVQSAFDSLFRRAKAGAFADLKDRDSLWRLLISITHCKTRNLIRRETQAKRGGGQVMGEAGFDSHSGLANEPDPEPTPELALALRENLEHLLDLLQDEQLKTIALLKLEQYSDVEIAARIGCSRATVERRTRLIRTIWTDSNLSAAH